MKIKWLGHACFLITSEAGIKIITDPYVTGDTIKYGKITETAAIVSVSHDHFDHNNASAVRGKPEVVKGAGKVQVKGIEFKGVSGYHDETEGSKRGNNIMFSFAVDGIRVGHLGDVGHQLSHNQASELGSIDILLIPVGGYYTIDARIATQVSNQLKPRVIIPMHFKTEKCDLPIAGVDEFIKGKDGVTRPDTSEVSFKKDELPTSTQIIVLKPEL